MDSKEGLPKYGGYHHEKSISVHSFHSVHSLHDSSEEDAAKKAMQDSSWADGLRGVAAVFVMMSHMSLSFFRYMVRPADVLGGPSRLMQKPFIRLIGQGPAWVACFFVLSGFVNALKPVKSIRAGNVDAALSNMAVSSFRRAFRLFLPATAATIISWAICQMGAYETARHSDAYWIQLTSPPRSWSFLSSLDDLVMAIRTTWMYNPNNPYDQPQWALFYLLQGSMMVFAALLVTAKMTTQFRILTMVLCWFWSWNWTNRLGDPVVGPNMFAGILLAELNDSNIPLRLSRYSLLIFPPLTILSAFLMSFPAEYQHYSHWSLFLLRLYALLSPYSETPRFWPTIGSQIFCFTIMCSPHLRAMFSHPIALWLGKISFPVYLLHGMFMRSILSWLLFAGQTLIPMEEERPKPPHWLNPFNTNTGSEMVVVMRYPLPSIGVFALAVPIFIVTLGLAAHYWSIKIEPHFGTMTKRVEEIMFGKDTRQSQLPFRHD